MSSNFPREQHGFDSHSYRAELSPSRSASPPQGLAADSGPAPNPPIHSDFGYISQDRLLNTPHENDGGMALRTLTGSREAYQSQSALNVDQTPFLNASQPNLLPGHSRVTPYGPASIRSGASLFADRDSRSSLNPFGTVVDTPSGTQSPTRSLGSSVPNHYESYADDPYQSYSRNDAMAFGAFNPEDIEDDGDDGLHYPPQNLRSSKMAAANVARVSEYAARLPLKNGRSANPKLEAQRGQGRESPGLPAQPSAPDEKTSTWPSRQPKRSRRWRWLVIAVVFLIVAGAIVGGVVGSLVSGNRNSGKADGKDSASDDLKKNGDLDVDSPEIKALLNNPNLHKVFPGMDYTPFNTQYPDCLHNPPSQNNVTRDVAVLSQLTNRIRLYGTDCNQTQMVIHAINQLKMSNTIKIWLGVWQDNNQTTNSRQLDQMWKILDSYGESPFVGIIVANEVIFRKDLTIASLGTILSDVRKKLSSKNIALPVATSDLGDDWTDDLASVSDYIMANIHPFFAGVAVEKAAAWTTNFWKEKDGPFWKTEKDKNIISETGWPSAGGKDCGAAGTTSCEPGAVAGISEMNRFMEDWVCQALSNGTNYFWFEAFDEPWKIRFNEPGKEWEDKWGLMDINRKLKDGVKIPDCGGKTVP